MFESTNTQKGLYLASAGVYYANYQSVKVLMMSEPINRKKLEWQCRRGMLELDVILSPFLSQHFDNLSGVQQQAFVELLSHPDPDIYTWVMGFGQCEHAFLGEILAKIRQLMKIA